jgi:hypothetical protein
LIHGHQLAMCGAKVENVEDQFNSWQSKVLMIHIEELQNENYQKHHFETPVKQFTTKESSSRAMHCETQQSTNQAIWGCNSDKSDLYGLIRADDATISILVILHSKPRPLELDCDAGFSLWHYLMFEYGIVNEFTIEDDNQVEKNELIMQLKCTAKSSFKCWFESLTFYDPLNQYLNQPHNMLLLQTDVKDGLSYVVLHHNEVSKSYDCYMRAGNSNFKCKQNTIISELTKQYGFEAKQNSGGIRCTNADELSLMS